jgi:glycosyltransferase involved in cell wall biosynthesis
MITGVILARNEEHNIVACLQSLRSHVAEIILIDMESSDKTVELARPWVSQVLTHPLVANFDPARNIAISVAQHDWLFFLDADERVPTETGRLVNEIIRRQGTDLVAITIPFKSYFCRVLSQIGQSLASRPDVFLWDATLEQAAMAVLYRSVDAFVLASRGEGWGRPYQEAMATGLPTIGTRGSGNDDFMDETNSFPVDTSPVEVSEEAAREIQIQTL